MVNDMWARIESYTVVETTDIDPAGRFHESVQWVKCSADVQVGWNLIGTEFKAPVPVKATREDVRMLRAAAYRFETDPLKNELEYDAFVAGLEPDYSDWMEKVAEIKERYPLP